MQEFHIRSLTLGPTKYEFAHDSIVCIIGPNNSGKSALLRAILHKITSIEGDGPKSLLAGFDLVRPTNSEEFDRLASDGITVKNGRLNSLNYRYPSGGHDPWSTLRENAMRPGPNGTFRFWLRYISAQDRLNAIKPPTQVDLASDGPSHPFHLMQLDPNLEKRLANVSRKLFGAACWLNPGAGGVVPFHFGGELDAAELGGDRSQSYANEVAKLPQVTEQGDGVQATLGLASILVTAPEKVLLVDEVDLYLHPPQAFDFAKEAANLFEGKQLFVTTHSSRVMQGFLAEARDRLVLIRLDKRGEEYSARQIDNETLITVRSDPLLRFTNVLESVFYKVCIVCEESADCLLVKTSMESLRLLSNEEDTFWVGANGKSQLGKVTEISRALGVRTLCICDFDILEGGANKDVERLVKAMGGSDEILGMVNKLDRMVERVPGWKALKRTGLSGLENRGDAYRHCDELLRKLQEIGIFVNKFGEAECLKTPACNTHGAKAVSEMISLDINHGHLEKLRKFAVDFSELLKGSAGVPLLQNNS